MTYVVIGRSGEFWNIAPICTNTYNYTNNAPALGVEALQEQLDNAYAQRDQ
jgi:hypothetical protein